MARYPTTTDELDRAEHEWWRQNADLEERFCWVQPPDVQRRLRGRYLRRIAAEIGPSDSVLEVGCGTGWLCHLLADATGASVTGIDFSAEQIRLARAALPATGRGQVRLDLASIEELVGEGRSFDVIVMHAFLHHLATAEIRAALSGARKLLAPGGRVVVLEPVMHGPASGRRPPVLRALQRIAGLPLGLSARRLRPISATEQAVRVRLEQPADAALPFGPAPKETPFEPGELLSLIEEHLRVGARIPVAAACFLVAQQLLLAELSQPRLWRALRDPLLRLTSLLDRKLVSTDPPPSGLWVFELLLCGANGMPA